MKKLLLPIAMGVLFACNTGEQKDSVEAAEDANEKKTELAPPAQVILVAEADQAGLMGFTHFSFYDGVHYPEATIPADAVPSRQLIFGVGLLFVTL